MVFLNNGPTQTEHRNKELVIRYVSLKGWESEKNKDPPLIRTVINGGPLILIHISNLTCLLPCNV